MSLATEPTDADQALHLALEEWTEVMSYRHKLPSYQQWRALSAPANHKISSSSILSFLLVGAIVRLRISSGVWRATAERISASWMKAVLRCIVRGWSVDALMAFPAAHCWRHDPAEGGGGWSGVQNTVRETE